MGILTDQRVESAVRDGCDRGFLMTLVDDACATHAEHRHREAMRGLGRCCRTPTTGERPRAPGPTGAVQPPRAGASGPLRTA